MTSRLQWRWEPSEEEMRRREAVWFANAREQVRQGNGPTTLDDMDELYFTILTHSTPTVKVWRSDWEGGPYRNLNWPYPLIIIQRRVAQMEPRELLPSFQTAVAGGGAAGCAGGGGCAAGCAGGCAAGCAGGSASAFGRKVHVGPRGGRYVLKNGKKCYI